MDNNRINMFFFLSIIIPLYNKQNSILNTVNSILEQDFDNYEIIIVDDGSTDNSVNIVESIRDKHINIFKKQNGGPSSARNYGVKMAQGEWILFLDADDTLEPNTLNLLHKTTSIHNKIHFFCFNHFIEDENGKHLFSSNIKDGLVKNPFRDWCKGVLMPRAGAAMYSKEMLITHPFNEKLHRYEDAENLFSLMRDYQIYYNPIPIMTYNCNNSSASKPCKNINDDFIGHLSLKGKAFWEQYALYQLYLQGCSIYPDDMFRIYGNKFNKIRFKVVEYFLRPNKRKIIMNPINHLKKSIKKIIRKCVQKSVPEISILQNNYNWGYINEEYLDVQKSKQVLIYSPAHISHTQIGDYTYIAQNSIVSLTTIGKFCSIGPNLICGYGIHPTNGLSTAPMFFSTGKQNGITLSNQNKIEEHKKIEIGNDVWIGSNVTIIDGIAIGDGAIIGAGAVVSKDIPPYAIAVGCPIRIIRYRFTPEQIDALLKIKWWNVDEEHLADVEKYFFDIDKFIEKCLNINCEA